MWFALPCFISSTINIIFGILVYYYNSTDIANKTFRNLMLAISLWCFSVGMNYISPNEEIALRWTILGLIPSFFIPPCFAHFCFAILKKYKLLTPPLYYSSCIYLA